jgi:RecA-family ATPase
VDFADLADMTWTSGAGEDNTLLGFDREGRPVLSSAFARLLSDARRFKARLVVVDTAADTFGGNENDRRQVRHFVGAILGKLALELNAAVLLCAHPSRAGRNSGDLDGGSTAWSNTARSRWALARPTVQHGSADPYERVLSRRKANYATIGDEVTVRWTRGAFLPVAPLTTEERHAKQKHAEIVFLRLFNRHTRSGLNLSPNSRSPQTYAPKVLAQQQDTEGLNAADLEDAMSRMLLDGRLRVESYGPPSRTHQRLAASYNTTTMEGFV